jgi:hypothetical protein
VASNSFASVDQASLGGSSMAQDSRAGATTMMKTVLPGRFVSICLRLVSNIGEVYTVYVTVISTLRKNDVTGSSPGNFRWTAFRRKFGERPVHAFPVRTRSSRNTLQISGHGVDSARTV